MFSINHFLIVHDFKSNCVFILHHFFLKAVALRFHLSGNGFPVRNSWSVPWLLGRFTICLKGQAPLVQPILQKASPKSHGSIAASQNMHLIIFNLIQAISKHCVIPLLILGSPGFYQLQCVVSSSALWLFNHLLQLRSEKSLKWQKKMGGSCSFPESLFKGSFIRQGPSLAQSLTRTTLRDKKPHRKQSYLTQTGICVACDENSEARSKVFHPYSEAGETGAGRRDSSLSVLGTS